MEGLIGRNNTLTPEGVEALRKLKGAHCSPDRCPICAQRDNLTLGPGGTYCEVTLGGYPIMTREELRRLFGANKPLGRARFW